MITGINPQYKDDLIKAILSLENEEQAKSFFIDLCSENEIMLMEQRFAVAKMLHGGKTYQEIAEETGASTATISRVSRSLNSGNKGYVDVIKGFEENAATK